jgi:hypothetical protein
MSTAHQSLQHRSWGVATLAALLAALGLSACSGTVHPTAPATPNPDQAAGMVLRFYRDVVTGGLGAMTDLRSIVSSTFYQRHASQWNAQYGLITDPRLTIHSVGGRTVTYSLNYATRLNGWRLYSQRHGSWNLSYANNRWLLDSDLWHGSVVAIRDGYGRTVAVRENVDPAGQREFVYRGYVYTLYAGGWRGVAMAPVPASSRGTGGHVTNGASSSATHSVTRVRTGGSAHRVAQRSGGASSQKREQPRL